MPKREESSAEEGGKVYITPGASVCWSSVNRTLSHVCDKRCLHVCVY